MSLSLSIRLPESMSDGLVLQSYHSIIMNYIQQLFNQNALLWHGQGGWWCREFMLRFIVIITLCVHAWIYTNAFFLQYFIQNNMIYDPEYVFYDIRVSHYKSNMLLECSLFTRRVSCSLHSILHCVTFSLMSHILICIFLYFSNLCFVTECSSRCPYNRSPSSQNHVRSR